MLIECFQPQPTQGVFIPLQLQQQTLPPFELHAIAQVLTS